MTRSERLVVEGLERLPQFAHAGITGDLIFVSGTIGTRDGDSLLGDVSAARPLVEGGITAETTQSLVNVGRILEAAGATWNDVAKVNVFLADMAEFPAMNEAYGAFFDGTPPARITVGQVGLAIGARIEIDCVARRPARPGPARAPATPPQRTGFVEHDGESLYYEVIGDRGVPLVLNHGSGGNHAIWYQQVAEFARDRTVVIWDHRGHGRSTDRAGHSGPRVAGSDLLAVLDHLGIASADLVGQSMGGRTIVSAALARPGLARSLVLADTLGAFTSPEIAAALDALAPVPPPAYTELGAHPALSAGFTAREPARAHLYQMLGRMGSGDTARGVAQVKDDVRQPAEARKLTMPALCVVGDQDPIFPPSTVRALAGLLPDARVVEITGCGHSPYFENPDTWNAVVRHFLNELDRTETSGH